MVRAVLSIVGILVTVAVLAWCFGVTMPQVTTSLPALNRSVAHTVGLMQGGQVEIREGLAEGDIVVARAGALLREGDPVRPVTASADPK